MTIWHEERLLIDGELVPRRTGRDLRHDQPGDRGGARRRRRCHASPTRNGRSPPRGVRSTPPTGRATTRSGCAACASSTRRCSTTSSSCARSSCTRWARPCRARADRSSRARSTSSSWYADLLEGYEFTEDLGERDTFAGRHHRWIEKEAAGRRRRDRRVQLSRSSSRSAKLAPALAAGLHRRAQGRARHAVGDARARQAHRRVHRHPARASSTCSRRRTTAVGAELTTHPDVDVVSFTGSTPVGRQIMAAASATVKRVFLELGGKSAFVLLDDGDVGAGRDVLRRTRRPRTRVRAARSRRVWSCRAIATTRSSTSPGRCSTASRTATRPIPRTMMGPLISARQREKVAGYVDRAIADGAEGGHRRRHPRAPRPRASSTSRRCSSAPTRTRRSRRTSCSVPCSSCCPHDGDDDAVRIANNSIFGLSGAVLSADRERALGVARRIRAGTMSVNGGVYYGPDAPFGGYKQSGIGREMGAAGLDEFLERKTLAEPAG